MLPLFMVLDHSAAPGVASVRETGQLRVLTIPGPTTYYRTADGHAGFEYELLQAFARQLGVTLKIERTDSIASIFPRLMRGDAHLAAAALNMTASHRKLVRFSEPYQSITTEVVYRRGDAQPEGFADLVGRDITVPAGSSYAQLLNVKKTEYPDLAWRETSDATVEDLLVEVWAGNTSITFAPSNLLAIVRQHHPDLEIGFTLEATGKLAWAFRPDSDDSLINAANRFIDAMRDSGKLERLVERYYGAVTRFDYVNVKTFRRRIKSVLPRFESLFREAAAEYQLDWRLLAAQSYQESYWQPGAVSPTGVEGLMQLTRATAEFMEVEDRTDPRQSVFGGARYLRNLYDRIDETVTEPDRTWFTLTAYNMGLGHLLDARDIARRLDKDPDLWTSIKATLPLLSDPEWYSKVEYGQAPGRQAVAYVTRIRSFYDILAELKPQTPTLKQVEIDVPVL